MSDCQYWIEAHRRACAQLAEAATFLDWMAERLSPRELWSHKQGMFDRYAADCREMAEKLREGK